MKDSSSFSPNISELVAPEADSDTLNKVLTMLEKALVCNAQSVHGGCPKKPNRQSVNVELLQQRSQHHCSLQDVEQSNDFQLGP